MSDAAHCGSHDEFDPPSRAQPYPRVIGNEKQRLRVGDGWDSPIHARDVVGAARCRQDSREGRKRESVQPGMVRRVEIERVDRVGAMAGQDQHAGHGSAVREMVENRCGFSGNKRRTIVVRVIVFKYNTSTMFVV